jgi:hypothetical protein
MKLIDVIAQQIIRRVSLLRPRQLCHTFEAPFTISHYGEREDIALQPLSLGVTAPAALSLLAQPPVAWSSSSSLTQLAAKP